MISQVSTSVEFPNPILFGGGTGDDPRGGTGDEPGGSTGDEPKGGGHHPKGGHEHQIGRAHV